MKGQLVKEIERRVVVEVSINTKNQVIFFLVGYMTPERLGASVFMYCAQ